MRGFLLSMDALVAILILFLVAFSLLGLTFTYSLPQLKYQRMYYVGKDILNVMGKVTVSDIRNYDIVQDFFDNGFLNQNDLNKTVMDVVGSLWASGNVTEAENLTNAVFGEFLNSTNYNFEILMNGERVYINNKTPGINQFSRFSTVVSGYKVGKPVWGYVARAYLTKATKTDSTYVYFGGYVGDGNISKMFVLPEYENITSVYMEMAADSNFDLYVNDVFSGSYSATGSGNMSTDKWYISSSYFDNFHEGNNSIKINFTAPGNNYIGGGYIKITYNTTEFITEPDYIFGENATETYRFPGIEGIINLYSSFFVPGTISNMSVYLHYKSNYTIFLALGNETVYEGNGTEEQNITIYPSLDYADISKKTVPMRLGLRNVSYITLGGNGTGDAVLSTDVSGSMNDCGEYMEPYICHYRCVFGGSKSCEVSDPADCTDNVCGGFCIISYNHYLECNRTKLEIAQEANKEFIDIVLNESIPGNRVGLNSYSSSIQTSESLNNDAEYLKSKVDEYTAYGSTCICCGIEDGINTLSDQSDETRRKTIVIMTDGEANIRCYTASTDLNGDSVVTAKDDTIQSACNAYNDYNITVYTIGFGLSEDEIDNETLYLTAQCGHGEYYFSNASELANTFRQIATDFVNGSYVAQTIEMEGNLTAINTLYPDSYIEFNYTSEIEPPQYGQIIFRLESANLGNFSGTDIITDNTTGTKEGWFYIPENVEIVDIKITSYSSQYWTDRLYIKNESAPNWTNIYWLSDYDSNYTNLGDPYTINIPVEYIGTGENNSIKIGTGTGPDNATGASPDDRVIYTIRISGINLEGYSNVFSRAKGSRIRVYYDIDGDNISDNYEIIAYGFDPDDIFDPSNDSIDDAFMRLMDDMNFLFDANPDGYGNGTLENPYDGLNETNPIDLQIASDIKIESGYIPDVPSLWDPVRLEINVWI